MQFMPDDAYRDWIRTRAGAAMAHHGFDADSIAEPIISTAGERRRIALKAMKIGAKLVMGFSQKNSHKLVDIDMCPVAHQDIVAILPDLRHVMNTLLKPRAAASLHLTRASNGLDLLLERQGGAIITRAGTAGCLRRNTRPLQQFIIKNRDFLILLRSGASL